MSKFLAAAALAALMAAPAEAVTSYVTTIDFSPSGDGGTSTDPADGNRVVLEWVTAATSGMVTAPDLTDLTFVLFGDDGVGGHAELFRDAAIGGGVAQDIAGVPRTICAEPPSSGCNILFSFDLDAFALDPASGLLLFDNDGPVDQAGAATGSPYNIFGRSDVLAGFGDVFAAFYPDGVDDVASSVESSEPSFETSVVGASVPLPLPGALLLTGLAAMAVAGRRRPA